MRRLIHLLTIVFFSAIILFSSCTKSVNMSVMKPAYITIPANIKSIAMVNRTKPINKASNIIEGVLTGELPGDDKNAVNQIFNGLNGILSQTNRYQVVNTDKLLVGSGSGGILPNPLSWQEIESICKEHNTDGVIAIETFDSDFIVTNGSVKKEKKDKEGNVIPYTEYWAKGVTTIKMGLRFYNPKTKSIVDQFQDSKTSTFRVTGNSIQHALSQLIAKSEAIKNVSFQTGQVYGRRIAPSWVRVSRTVFKKPKKHPSMAAGMRYADVGQWENAAAEWQKVVDQGDRKSKRNAAHNIAVVNEVLGDLQMAKNWADDAFVKYGNKKSRDYSRILQRRLREQQRLNEQLGK